MLKLTYSDTDFLIEHLDLTVEAVVLQRSLVALRAGQPLVVEPSYGSFVLPADLPGLGILEVSAPDTLALAPCDYNWYEVTLRGTWLAESPTSAEGILVVDLGVDLERRVTELWRLSRTPAVTHLSQSEAAGGL